ncbi:MAG: serine hydrolase domain-containing protein [Anaerolineaceae bacterium]
MVKETISIKGDVAPEFEPVREAFERNFIERKELGAACAAYCGGRKVVDLWGGLRDEHSGAEWEEDTLAMVSSTTIGLTALAVALAHSRGYFELDQPVCNYWPEFSQSGKLRITVRQLMAHQAGLCAIDPPLTYEDVKDLDTLARILASQQPAWVPGTRQGFHAVTLGWYAGELIRRVDPSHRSLGRFFREEIAIPLGLEFYIGLPSDIPDSRLASIREFGLSQTLTESNLLPIKMALNYLNPNSLTSRAFATPIPKTSDERKRKRDFLAVEGPGYNGVGTARSIARAYNIFALGGKGLRLKSETLEALVTPAPPPSAGLEDMVTGLEVSFSLGMLKPFRGYKFGSSPHAYGMPGAGGSFGYADPDTGSGFAYIPSKWNFRLHDDPRQISLWQTFQNCLSRLV